MLTAATEDVGTHIGVRMRMMILTMSMMSMVMRMLLTKIMDNPDQE